MNNKIEVAAKFLAGCATHFELLGDVISVERAKELRALLAAPSVERQDEPVAWAMQSGLDRCARNPKASHAVYGHNGENGWDVPLYAEQPAPVSVADKYDYDLLPFVALMRKELHANAGKGDRAGWLEMSTDTALLEIIYHFGKLQASVKRGDEDGIREYAADVANMCMMLVDICACLDKVKEMNP